MKSTDQAVCITAQPIRFFSLRAEIHVDLWMYRGEYARVQIWYFRHSDPTKPELTSSWSKTSKRMDLYRAGQLAAALVRRYSKLALYQVLNGKGKNFIFVPDEEVKAA